LDVAMSLASVTFWTQASKRSPLVGRIPVIAYDIACIIWIYCFWRAPKSEPAVHTAPLSPAALHEAKKWEESLKDYISSGKR